MYLSCQQARICFNVQQTKASENESSTAFDRFESLSRPRCCWLAGWVGCFPVFGQSPSGLLFCVGIKTEKRKREETNRADNLPLHSSRHITKTEPPRPKSTTIIVAIIHIPSLPPIFHFSLPHCQSTVLCASRNSFWPISGSCTSR